MASEKRMIDPDAKFIEKHFTKRLIDAEAIERKLKNQYCAECNVVRQIQCSACWVNDVLELLDGDSVDAVSVVHGHWEKYTDDKFMGYGADGRIRYRKVYSYKCSKCWNYTAVKHNYCPNCGAKMDGDGNG